MGASEMRAAVLSTYSFSVKGGLTSPKCVIPATGTTSYASFLSEDEAYYFCAVLNSSLVNAYIKSFSSAGRGFGAPSIVSKFNIPLFDPKLELHLKICDLSKSCHKFAAEGKKEILHKKEKEVDIYTAKLWNISEQELNEIII